MILMTEKLPANKKFGSLMSSIFFILSGYFLFKDSCWLFYFSFLLTIFFMVITFLDHQILTRLNQLWFSFGKLLGKIISPLVLGGIFFLLITPIAIAGKIFGRDILKIKKPLAIETYWIKSNKRDKNDHLFENQF